MRFLFLRQRIDKISPTVDQAAAVFYALHLMIPTVSVPYQIAGESLQKCLRILALSGRLVIENDDAAVIHFAVAVHPHLGVGCRFSAFLMQNLNRGFISMDHRTG